MLIENKIRSLIRKAKNLKRRVFHETKVEPPAGIMLELTNRCNLHCTTCPRENELGRQMDIGSMPIEHAKMVIDEVGKSISFICLTELGETFLYGDIVEITEYIRKITKAAIFISTNAHVPQVIEKFSLLSGKISILQISIDGVGETYDNIRKGGRYETFFSDLKIISSLAKKNGTKVMLNMVVTKENYRDMIRVVELASSNDIPMVHFNFLNVVSNKDGLDSAYYDFFQKDEFINEFSKVVHLSKISKKLKITTFDYASPGGFAKCPFPWDNFYITWDGYLVPCCAKPFPKVLNFGNVIKEGLMNCINGEPFRKFRTLWYENRTPDFCRNCHIVDFKPIYLS